MAPLRVTFRPGLTAAGALALALLVGLGTWQVRRLGESQAWIAEMTHRLTLPEVPVAQALADPDDFAFRRVGVTGRYDEAESVLLEHRGEPGRNGAHLLTPLRIAGRDRALLVDRGFLPRSAAESLVAGWADARRGPASSRDRDRNGGAGPAVEVRGVLRPARRRRLPDVPPARQLRWHRLDVAGLERQLPYALETAVLIRSDDGSGVPPIGSTPVPRARVNHLHYAVTWYGSAAVLLVVLVALQVGRRTSNGPGSSGASGGGISNGASRRTRRAGG